MKELLNTRNMWECVTENINLPEWLDYSLVATPSDILDIEYDVRGDLSFGGSEGIYLDMYISGNFSADSGDKTVRIGTFKTLREDDDAFRQMAVLMADFILTEKKWRNEQQDNLIRRGYCVKKAGKCSVYVQSREKALSYRADGYEVTDLYTGGIL